MSGETEELLGLLTWEEVEKLADFIKSYGDIRRRVGGGEYTMMSITWILDMARERKKASK